MVERTRGGWGWASRESLGLKLSTLSAFAAVFLFAVVLLGAGLFSQEVGLIGRLFALGAPCVFLSALVVHWWIGRLLAPMVDLRRALDRLEAGEWLAPIAPAADDEIGGLARSLETFRRAILTARRTLNGGVSGVEAGLRRLETRLGPALAESRLEVETATSGAARLDELVRALPPLSSTAGRLGGAIEQHAVAVRVMAAGMDGIAAAAESLNLAVDEAAANIEQIAASIQQVAASTGRLSGSMDEAVSAISRIEGSIRQVEQDTRQASHLSQQVSQEAVRGGVAVRKTIEGMRRIRRSVQQTAKVVRTLGGRSKEIGEILHVIDEIAGQTNLLAINAAIIAAQAGEQGKGFALVAEEIRDLAERTAASTKEIDALIKTVQRESAQAVDAMEEVLSSVEEGVALGNNAGEALDRILERAESSSSTARAIAEAIQEQSFGSKRVTQEIENIRTMVKQINLASQAQAQASMLLTRATRETKEHAESVTRATAEQVQRSVDLGLPTTGLEREAFELQEAIGSQLKSLEAFAAHFSRLRAAGEGRVAYLGELDAVARDLDGARTALIEAVSGIGGPQRDVPSPGEAVMGEPPGSST
jgi:methyl-accepting chemotaxis protein